MSLSIDMVREPRTERPISLKLLSRIRCNHMSVRKAQERTVYSCLSTVCTPQMLIDIPEIFKRTHYLALHTHRLLPKRRNTEPMPQSLLWIGHVIIRYSRVRRHAIIPQGDRAVIPLHTYLNVSRVGDVLFGTLVTRMYGNNKDSGWDHLLTLKRRPNKASDSSSFSPMIRLVKPGCTNRAFCPVTCTPPLAATHPANITLTPRSVSTYRMHPYNRMLRFHRLPAYKLPIPPRALGLPEPVMLCPQPLQQLLDRLRQPLVSSDLRNPCRISARGGNFQQREHGDRGWLVLVRDIGVVARGRQLRRAQLCAVQVVGAEIDIVEFNVIFHVSTDGLNDGSCQYLQSLSICRDLKGKRT